MFYYVDQLRTSFFPIGLVKAKSNFIVRPVEIGDRSKETELGSGKDRYWDSFRVMSHMEVCSYSYFWWCEYF